MLVCPRTGPRLHHLTEFYLWISAGGVLGGLFNALVAPVLFSGLVEYPLVLVLAALLRVGLTGWDRQPGVGQRGDGWPGYARDVVFAVCLGVGAAVMLYAVGRAGLTPDSVRLGMAFGPTLLVGYLFLNRPVRHALGLGAVFLAAAFAPGVYGRLLDRERSFFGIHRVTIDPTYSFHQLVHGNTVHGRQSMDPKRRDVPLTYYHPTGPIGQVMTACNKSGSLHRVGIIGLGAGSLAAYAQPDQKWTFYEIDPTVERIARDPRLFTFLRDSKASPDVVLGDARLTLSGDPDGAFDLLVLDAFTSDAIPIHLLTREAFEIYRRKLKPDGILAVHVSNRYLDLEPVVARLGQEVGWSARAERDLDLSPEQTREGKSPSDWMILGEGGRLTQAAGPPARWDGVDPPSGQWYEVNPRPGTPLWTDDYSYLLGVVRW